MGCVGIDEEDNIWVLPDLFWRRAQTDVVCDAMLDQFRRNAPLLWWAEKGHISKAIGPFLRKRMQEEKIYCAIDEVTPSKDKQTRAQAIRGRMAMGKVFFPKFAGWWPAAQLELLKFPAARHDDFVDWLAHIGMGLNLQVGASAPSKADTGPRTGTLAWVKHSSKMREWGENRLRTFWS
jgi:predicted phage terminase large subunit-like protein